jgi:hypothetical protein
MNLRDLSAVERTAAWLDELIEICRPRGRLSSADAKLVRDVTRKAKALRTSLTTLRASLIPDRTGEADAHEERRR